MALRHEVIRILTNCCRTYDIPAYIFIPEKCKNVGKYPLMRRMFYAESVDICPLSELVMWFDDDSHVIDTFKSTQASWFKKVACMAANTDILGSIYRPGPHYPMTGQIAGIKQQPWYAGADISRDMLFITGGWWVARTALLKSWNYPFEVIHHNGGDIILGELCRQQKYRIQHFNDGVAINYDAARGGESRAERRGLTSSPPWANFKPDKPVSLCHQKFFHDVYKVHSTDTLVEIKKVIDDRTYF
jgi:hypothetical protein